MQPDLLAAVGKMSAQGDHPVVPVLPVDPVVPEEETAVVPVVPVDLVVPVVPVVAGTEPEVEVGQAVTLTTHLHSVD